MTTPPSRTSVTKTRRLLVVSSFYPPRPLGGAEVVAHRHALLMRARGWHVTAFAGVLPSDEFPHGTVHVETVDGIEVVLLALRSLDPDDNFRWTLANNVLQSLIATTRPDWIHAHNLVGLGADLIGVARRAGIPVALTLHDNWGYCFKNTRLRNNGALCRDAEECHLCLPSTRARAPEGDEIRLPIRMRRDFVRYRLQQADRLISPSADLAHRYGEGGIDPARIVVQSNGIDLTHIPARPRRPGRTVRLLCAAYMGEHKGIPVLLNAIRLLQADTRITGRWSITIAGHGNLADTVEDDIRTQGWTNVRFLGRQPREALLRTLGESDVVILPSIWPENEPVILLEAIASGAALLASRLGGSIDLVGEKAGLLFEPGNPQSLADAIRRLVENPALIVGFSQANIEARPTLDEKKSAACIHTLLQQPPPPKPDTDPVIICGGRPTLQSMVLVSLLAKVIPRLNLLWHDWIHPEDWDNAIGYWHWTPDDNVAQVADALKRALPVIAPAGPLSDLLEHAGAAVHPYNSARELWPAIETVCNAPRSTPERSAARSLYRFELQMRDHLAFQKEVGA